MMRTSSFIFIVSLLTSSLFANTAKQADQSNCTPTPHHFSVGGQYTRAYLKPNSNPSFSGNMGGIQLIYEHQLPNTFYAGGVFDWRYGHLHASNGKRKLQDFNIQERLGYSVQLKNLNSLITVFSGFGYRHLRHTLDLRNSSGMSLYYNHFYIPLGILTKFKLNPCFSMGFNALWMPQVFPTVTLSPIEGARWKTRRTFKNFLAELPLTVYLDSYVKNLNITLTPQFELWQDGPSTAKTASGNSLGLPSNTYLLWSGKLSVGYSF